MRRSTFVRKPPGKRGVNKATMSEPQEEFITDGPAKVEKTKQSASRQETVLAARKSADQMRKK